MKMLINRYLLSLLQIMCIYNYLFFILGGEWATCQHPPPIPATKVMLVNTLVKNINKLIVVVMVKMSVTIDGSIDG